MDREEERESVFDAVDQAWNDFVFYYRKLDKQLSAQKLRQLVRDGVVTKDEIVERWRGLVLKWEVDK